MVVCSLKQGPIYYVHSVYLLLVLVATKASFFCQVDLSPCCIAKELLYSTYVLSLWSSTHNHMNTVHLSGLWNLYDCQAQLSTVTHVCHHKKVPSFLHVFVSRWIKLLLNMWCIDWIAWYLQPIQTSTTNDRHIALADHFVFLWVSALCGTLP